MRSTGDWRRFGGAAKLRDERILDNAVSKFHFADSSGSLCRSITDRRIQNFRRALYAALRVQEDIKRYSNRLRIEKGVPLAIRVGLNSGEMVVRAIYQDDLHTDYVPI